MNQHTLSGRQLMFDECTNNIIEKPLNYWKTVDEIPKYIKEFILNTASSRVIYDVNTKQYYCSKCLKKLDDQYYCTNCSKQCIIPISNNSKYVIQTNITTIKEYEENTRYFVFDIIDGQVLIYIFHVHTFYYNHIILMPYQMNKITIEGIYHITNIGLTNILTNEFFSFEEYDKSINDDDFNYELLNLFEFQSDNHYLYINNLATLQNTSLYKYTSIWDLKDYFENENFNLASLTYYPLYFRQFEYLVKMKLYRLAATGPNLIEYKHTFKDTFGIDKKYYSFMKEYNIDSSQLSALRLCPTTDIELLNFVAKELFLFKELSVYVSPNKIKTYLENQKLDYRYIYEYYDYIKCCEYMSFNLKDKNILFPENLIKQHNKLTSEMIIATDPMIDKKIHSLSNILSLNVYEDETYVIFPANCIDSLIDESSQMSNCVRNYCKKMSNNECQIYFMRYKKNIKQSLVTIEVRNGKIVQARTRFNEFPTDEMKKILKKWEKQIIPIINE